ncbi:ankyrin repeat-containing protein [Vitreoscilla sp. C1]|uniref:ankyrin repeat domain-containing protein n=1 Tax=Vitreoscilla sp. (strain C1) TaxID=96942 RepID=UPI000CDBD1B4|nr:ankyrin repeat domain-containing protein [Vitreoscilla sp. C1]AUZ06096.1 ankyrin repeat-containing protein [Vitreoscilla sp. C1]
MTIPELDNVPLEYANQMFEAVRNGNADGVLKCIQQVDLINLIHTDGQSLLTLACELAHEDVVRVLLEKGADVQAANGLGQTPLMIAAANGQATMAKLLLDHGAAVDVQDASGRTPFILAAMSNHTDVMEVLLSDGANIHHADAEGRNAMDAAKILNAEESLAWLELYLAGEKNI